MNPFKRFFISLFAFSFVEMLERHDILNQNNELAVVVIIVSIWNFVLCVRHFNGTSWFPVFLIASICFIADAIFLTVLAFQGKPVNRIVFYVSIIAVLYWIVALDASRFQPKLTQVETAGPPAVDNWWFSLGILLALLNEEIL